MKNLVFILWICLWPIATSLNDFIVYKLRVLKGKEDYSDDSYVWATLIYIVIWISVANMLYVP